MNLAGATLVEPVPSPSSRGFIVVRHIVPALLCATCLLSGCDNDSSPVAPSQPSTPAPVPSTPVDIVMTPDAIKLSILGSSIELKAESIEIKSGTSSISLSPAGVDIKGMPIKLNS